MQDTQLTWQRTLSRVVLGLLLAGAVYLLAESMGLGGSRRAREITFLLPARAISQLEAVYLFDQEIVRQTTLPAKGARAVIDSAKLPAGEYELQILLRSPAGTSVSQRTIQLRDEEQLSINLQKE
jgi:hypothetical protein